MRAIDPLKAGLTVGAVYVLVHLVWLGLVAAGQAQSLLDWLMQLHSLDPILRVGRLDPRLAISLLGVSAISGFTLGALLACAWNQLNRDAPSSKGRVTRQATH